MSRYQETINNLTSSTKFHIKLGLERTKEFLKLLDNPQNKYPIIHIAGTNGKGSTSAMLSNILTTSNYKTGLFTSPHIFEYTERIKINNTDISKDKFSTLIDEICQLAEKNNFELTEFETLTCAMFKYFADEKVDIAIVEVGLGGRLDSTNVITTNLCSVITSISFDHTDRLGNTIEEIAYEKACIIKEKRPVITKKSTTAFSTIEKYAQKMQAPILCADDNVEIKFENKENFAYINGKKYEFSLLGLYQKENLALVVKTVDFLRNLGYKISEQNFEKALKTTKWNARFQYIKEKNLLIDAAHNPDGAKVLKESLNFYFPNIKKHWIYGSLDRKDYSQTMKILFDENDIINFYHFKYNGACTAETLQKNSPLKGKEITLDEITNLINNNSQEKLLILTGSFYMLDEILSSVGII